MSKTTHISACDIEDRWLVYDASLFPLGRMATQIAMQLMGKDRPTFTASEICGAHVVVLNSAKAKVTGQKNEQKKYKDYSGYPGGLHLSSMDQMRQRRPNDIVTLAVRRMLPKGPLGKKMLSRLKVYPGTDHPHAAQSPVAVESLGA